MTALDMTRQEMGEVIGALNGMSGAGVSVLNEGQLGFALEKPRMSLCGRELYPELHQKAAVLMETLCKSHALTDGNKRAAVMAAEYVASINGSTLVVPLKTARLTVDCAMDAGDEMSGEIAAWFKTHIARDELELAVMLEEVVEERDAAAALLDQGRRGEAERIADGWLAFDSNPEGKRAWSELVEKWSRASAPRRGSPGAWPHFSPWLSLSRGLYTGCSVPRLAALPEPRAAGPVYTGHGPEELERAEAHIKRSVEELRSPRCGADALWNAGLLLESFGRHMAAVRIYDRLLSAGGRDTRHALSRKLVNLALGERYEEARAVADHLAGAARR